MTKGSTRALIAKARERVAAHRAFTRTYPARNSLTELYDEHERLANTLETLVADMHERELHHFEVEQELARLKGET